MSIDCPHKLASLITFAFMLNRWFLLLGFTLFSLGQAQDNHKLDLAKCIDVALENNIDVLISQINKDQSELDYKQSLWNLGPEVSFSGGQFYQSGRSIDRFTNQFVQETIGNSSLQVSSSWVVYAGGSLRKSVLRSRKQVKASELDYQQSKQNIALSVALAYLQCLQANEQKKANESNVQALQQEQKRIEKLVALGSVNEGVLLSSRAQLSQARATKVQAEMQHQSALLNLKNLLRLPIESTFDIEYSLAPAPEYTEYPAGLNELIDSALFNRADYKSALLKKEAAALSIGISKSQLLPTLSVGGNLSSIYSDKALRVTGFQISGSQPIGIVQGTNEIVEAPTFDYQTQTIAFNQQMRDNFGQSFGANLSVPILGKLRGQNAYKSAKLAYIQQDLSAQRIRQNAILEVTNAYQNFKNAAMQYQAQRENHEAQKRNLEFVQKRFENGQATYFELQLAKNQELLAYQNYLSNKYEAALRNLILDVMYRGNLQLIKP